MIKNDRGLSLSTLTRCGVMLNFRSSIPPPVLVTPPPPVPFPIPTPVPASTPVSVPVPVFIAFPPAMLRLSVLHIVLNTAALVPVFFSLAVNCKVLPTAIDPTIKCLLSKEI